MDFGTQRSQANPASAASVRQAFLQDFFNDAFHAINTAVQTGIVDLSAAPEASQASQEPKYQPTSDQTPKGQEIAAKRIEKQKLAQKNIDDLSKDQYKQPKKMTPAQTRQMKQAAAAQKAAKQTKQQYAQSNVAAKSASKDPNTVLEAMDSLNKIYLTEQEQSMRLSDFILDFFNDYVSGANANYSKYMPQITKIAQQIEQEWMNNPKGFLGRGYSKQIRTLMTQLGDLALSIYKLKKGTATTTTPTKAESGRAADALLNMFGLENSEPITFGGVQYRQGPNGIWLDPKGKPADKNTADTLTKAAAAQSGADQSTASPSLSQNQLRDYIKNLNIRQKQQLLNYIMQTMPMGQDLK